MNKTIATLFIVFGAIAFFACNDGVDYEKMRKEELSILKKYIDDVHPNAIETSSGLYYIIEEESGSTDTISPGDKVYVYYATWVLNSVDDIEQVDETEGYLDGQRYEPYDFVTGASTSITGLEEAVTYMYPGTRAKLIINSELAYGQSGSSGTIGAFQTVIMEIEIKKVVSPDGETTE